MTVIRWRRAGNARLRSCTSRQLRHLDILLRMEPAKVVRAPPPHVHATFSACRKQVRLLISKQYRSGHYPLDFLPNVAFRSIDARRQHPHGRMRPTSQISGFLTPTTPCYSVDLMSLQGGEIVVTAVQCHGRPRPRKHFNTSIVMRRGGQFSPVHVSAWLFTYA
jgi:hypothetical protein